MAVELEINGILREYELFIPLGAAYWATEAARPPPDGANQDGLPLIVMLHGWGEKPGRLKDQWNLEARISGGQTWQDKAFVLVPYGLSEQNNEYGAGAEPLRNWNAWSHLTPSHVEDATAINAMITHADGLVQSFYADRGVSKASFNVDRIHLFGYSTGAIMAFRMAEIYPNKFASIFAVCGTDGGRTYQNGIIHINAPYSIATSTKGISVALYVGGADDVIPPGNVNQTGVQNYSGTVAADLFAGGVPDPEHKRYAPWFRTAYDTVKDYIDYNRYIFSTFNNALLAPTTTTSGQVDVTGVGNARETRSWSRSSTNTNPEVRLIRDNAMDHSTPILGPTGFGRYIFEADVLTFFRTHPRV